MAAAFKTNPIRYYFNIDIEYNEIQKELKKDKKTSIAIRRVKIASKQINCVYCSHQVDILSPIGKKIAYFHESDDIEYRTNCNVASQDKIIILKEFEECYNYVTRLFPGWLIEIEKL